MTKVGAVIVVVVVVLVVVGGDAVPNGKTPKSKQVTKLPNPRTKIMARRVHRKRFIPGLIGLHRLACFQVAN